MTIVIDSRYCGPPHSGNGGYACGLLAAQVGASVEVTLRLPPPLDTPLRVERSSDGARLLWGERLVAEALAVEFEMQPPPPPSWEEAQAAARRYRGLQHHDFPGCFVCGPQRRQGDGLRIFSGPVRPGLVAAPWVPDSSLSDSRGRVRLEILWAAIDCAGYWVQEPKSGGQPTPLLLLGRYAGRFLREVEVGEECIVTGWGLGVSGRKYQAGTALHTRGGELLGYSRQTWVETGRN